MPVLLRPSSWLVSLILGASALACGSGGASSEADGGSAGMGGSVSNGPGGSSSTGGSSGGNAGSGSGGSGAGAAAGGVGGSGAGTGSGGSSVYDPDGVPAVLWLTTPSVPNPNDIGEEDVAGEIRIIEDHDGRHVSPSDFATMPAALEAFVTVHIRGNSSLEFPKKNFALELQDALGNQVKLPVLGMPKESDWVLHGPYTDKTYLRNALAYWLGREMYRGADGTIETGRWNPRTRFAELYINQQYWGVYVVVEKVKADADRVDVDRPASSTELGDVSGGYIIRREGAGDPTENRDWVSTVEQLVYTHHYPRVEDITPDQTSYIHNYFDQFETMMRGSSWNDASSGYPAWIEQVSWVDYFLATEWSNNVDGYFKSVYFVKYVDSAGGRLAISPLWDFNVAFGNADYRNGDDTENWVYTMMGTENSDHEPPGEVPFVAAYFAKLWTEPSFRLAMRCRWQELRAGPLATATVHARVDQWVEQLAAAEVRDHQRWPTIGQQLWPNPIVWESYAEEVAYLKSFVQQRFAFLDQGLPELAPGSCN